MSDELLTDPAEFRQLLNALRPSVVKALGRHVVGDLETEVDFPANWAATIVESIAWNYFPSVSLTHSQFAVLMAAMVAYIPRRLPTNESGLVDMERVLNRLRSPLQAVLDAYAFHEGDFAQELIEVASRGPKSAFKEALNVF